VLAPVRSPIQPQGILYYEYPHHSYLQPPEHLLLGRGEIIGMEHKDKDGNQVQSNDDDIDGLSQRGFKIDHIELNRLSKRPPLFAFVGLSGRFSAGHLRTIALPGK